RRPLESRRLCAYLVWYSMRGSADGRAPGASQRARVSTLPQLMLPRRRSRPNAMKEGKSMPVLLPDPFGNLLAFQEALEVLRASGWLESSPSGAGPYPPINVFRKGDDFVLITELPGIKKSEFDIQVKENTVRIAGSKDVSYPEKAALH